MFDLDIDLPPNETSHACITFLHTILGKSCREIHISTESCPSSEDGENMPPGSTPRDWLVDFWPPNHSPPKTQHLETCSIESFPKSLRPFYYHTLLVNGSSITSLSFCRVKPGEGGEDLTTMLNELYFPHLRHLSLTTLTVPCDGIMRFLSRHPGTLSTFEYYAVEYTLRPVDPIQSDILEPIFCTLQTLTTSPEYVIALLPSFASMTGLRNVVIRSGERYHTSTLPGLIELLRRIALCVNRITLTLKFVSSGSVHFKHLLRLFDENHDDNIEILKNLHCIETLVIDNAHWGFTNAYILARFPRWLQLLPGLRTLVLRENMHPEERYLDEQTPHDVGAAVQKAYPRLRAIKYIIYPRDNA